ncbi:dihydrolipoamide acetyltransferase family protein [Aminobacter sp. J44]|uniref:dihydrolipoamide acetyltransferase family protein n=1 Tax=Aminobacter sp. J44 TaxID=935262 RepID=UPI0011990593|nr:dihydrolipoamide acetyltransferase family protein [Aminobacter sp. J44]TWG49313.1 pyruvate/2-oxoglutarate dehydrogenase complex dihydrolipoamide acyltransferase (E2) component [Aminobacter sp. J44]
MAEFIIKMPDVGEGVAEAELIEWHVKVGDLVREDTILAAVMTDKATVEIPSPVEGTITWLGAEIGDTVAVGSPIVKIEVAGSAGEVAGGDGQPAGEPSNAAGATGVSSPEADADEDTPTPSPSPQGGGELGEPGMKGTASSAASSKADASAPSSSVVAPAPPDTPTRSAPSLEAANRGDPDAGDAVGDDAGPNATTAVRPGSAASGTPTSPSPVWGGVRGGGSIASTGTASADLGSVSTAPAGRASSTTSPLIPRPTGEKPLASPAVRLRAKEAGIDLRQVHGTGPAGRITHEDLDQFISRGAQQPSPAGQQPNTSVEEIKVVGLRRRIAEKMSRAKARIPHITYVEEVNVEALEELRARLNAERHPDRPKLTILPFLMRAMVKAIAEQPQINAIFDDDAGIIHRHGGVHVGVATQTPSGLMVPVVRHAEARDLWDCAREVNRLADAARSGTATREELTGSTITITSLGAMGGIATTPVINYPEVAIVGVNKIMVRPVWDGQQFIPAKMMNLSSSFDHRVIDGWDAAVFVQRLKALLETPALIFVE